MVKSGFQRFSADRILYNSKAQTKQQYDADVFYEPSCICAFSQNAPEQGSELQPRVSELRV